MLGLRNYQRNALYAITEAERKGTRRPLVVHPTGSGKTVTFSHLIASRPGRSLVLVHREELVHQTREKLAIVAPELRVGIVKAERDEHDSDVVIASVQTAHRNNRLERLSGFDTVIVDEGHHAPSPTWRKVLTHVGSLAEHGPLTVGFTATPERDGEMLRIWDSVVHYCSIREMILREYLSPIVTQTVATSADFSRVSTVRGDLSEGGLGTALESEGGKALSEIAEAYRTYASERTGVAFTPTVATAVALADELTERGIAAEVLSGTTPDDERRNILARLRTGDTRVVTNCGVLTEGFDEPSISCIVVARPTKFHGLYIQMVGRGTRKHPGKTDLLVLDVTGASERHDLVALVDLGLEGKEKSKNEQEKKGGGFEGPLCELCNRPMSGEAAAQGIRRHSNCNAKSTTRTDPFEASKLRWLPVDNAWCLPAGKEVVIITPLEDELWRLVTYGGGKITTLHDSLPVDWAQGIGEDHAKAFGKLSRRDARWLNEPPTDAQLNRLVREGLPESKQDKVRTRGQAADLITRIQARRAVRKMASTG